MHVVSASALFPGALGSERSDADRHAAIDLFVADALSRIAALASRLSAGKALKRSLLALSLMP